MLKNYDPEESVDRKRAQKFYEKIKAISDAREEFDKALESEKLDGSTIVSDMFGDIGYDEELQAVQEYLLAQICILNGVKPKPYIKKSSRIKRNINPTDPEFIEESTLWGKYDEMFPQDEAVFKARFITALGTHYITILNDIVDMYTGKAFKKKRGKALKQCAKRFVDMMLAMLNDDDYSDELQHIIFEVMAIDKGTDTAFASLKDSKMIIKCFDGDLEWSDRKLITKIMKSAFNTATNSRGVIKPKIQIDEDDDILKDHQLSQGIVRMLGSSVIAYNRKKPHLSPLYRAWSLSKPYIETKFKHVNADPNLNQGCRTLEFWAFVTDDPCVKKFVHELIH